MNSIYHDLPDTSLTRASELAEHGTLGSKVEVSILKDNKGSVTAKLQAELLQGTSSKLSKRVGSKLGGSLAIASRKDLDGGRRETSLDGELGESEGGVGSLGRRLDNDGAAGGQRRGDLSGDHGSGEVPWCDDTAHANGLADGHEGGVRSGRGNGDANEGSRTVLLVNENQVIPLPQKGSSAGASCAIEVLCLSSIGALDGSLEVLEGAIGDLTENGGS
ncbi:hypothetical protein HG530_000759 [Fusarium avenaceum]|nr:hypothetical protein HG530_000759 [Fusarium avenaceum]